MSKPSDQLRQVAEALEAARLFPLRYPNAGAVKVIQIIDASRALLPALIAQAEEAERRATPNSPPNEAMIGGKDTSRPARGLPEGTGEVRSGSTPPSRSTEQQDDCRKAFEEWIINVTGYGSFCTERREGGDTYDSSHTHLMWLAWSASANVRESSEHPAAEIDRGKLVEVMQEEHDLAMSEKAFAMRNGWGADRDGMVAALDALLQHYDVRQKP